MLFWIECYRLDIAKSYLAIHDGSDTRPGKFFTEYTKSSDPYHHFPRDSYKFLKGKLNQLGDRHIGIK